MTTLQHLTNLDSFLSFTLHSRIMNTQRTMKPFHYQLQQGNKYMQQTTHSQIEAQ